MSVPFCGSTPMRGSQLIPPNLPLGSSVPPWMSTRFWWNSAGGSPRNLTITGAKTATSTRKIRKKRPAIASLSRLRRRQAIWRSDRPWMAEPVAAAGSPAAAGSSSRPAVTRGGSSPLRRGSRGNIFPTAQKVKGNHSPLRNRDGNRHSYRFFPAAVAAELKQVLVSANAVHLRRGDDGLNLLRALGAGGGGGGLQLDDRGGQPDLPHRVRRVLSLHRR